MKEWNDERDRRRHIEQIPIKSFIKVSSGHEWYTVPAFHVRMDEEPHCQHAKKTTTSAAAAAADEWEYTCKYEMSVEALEVKLIRITRVIIALTLGKNNNSIEDEDEQSFASFDEGKQIECKNENKRQCANAHHHGPWSFAPRNADATSDHNICK